MSPSSSRSRFLVNTVTSQMASSMFQAHKPTEQQVIVELFHQQPFACAPSTALAVEARANNFSGAIDGRPVFAYSLWNRGCSSLKASSVIREEDARGDPRVLAALGLRS